MKSKTTLFSSREYSLRCVMPCFILRICIKTKQIFEDTPIALRKPRDEIN